MSSHASAPVTTSLLTILYLRDTPIGSASRRRCCPRRSSQPRARPPTRFPCRLPACSTDAARVLLLCGLGDRSQLFGVGDGLLRDEVC
jgi:hypothetical protein